MNHKIHTSTMTKSNQSQIGFHQRSTANKKHISYNCREEYILDIEKKLMSKYRVGYSGLHKLLVVKEGNQQFGQVFL